MKRKEGNKRYRELKRELNQILLEWNPYCLCESSKQVDEFSCEVAKILTKLPSSNGVEDVAQALSTVFSQAFEPDRFPPESCTGVAATIWRWWQERGWHA